MQINTNTTGMEAGLTVATDKDGRDHCVVVVKGTFVVGPDGTPSPAETQEPLVTADIHYGDPAATSIQYECEFAMLKPRADVIVNGQAVALGGKPVTEMTVALELGSMRKEIRVVGDRRWEGGILGYAASDPVPFVTMPLVFERAFGGSDQTHPNPKHHGAELRNLVGVGFHKNSDGSAIEGSPLPNLERPRHPVRSWSDTPPPIGYGTIGRGWQPRVKYAGTYNQRWLDERFPFLPEDFDPQYFLAAPADQQVPHLKGGEVVRCLNMTPERTFELHTPRFGFPIFFRFRDRDVKTAPQLDTLIVEPDRKRFLAVWRASTPLGRKLNALREVVIGPRPRPVAIPPTGGRRRFRSLEEL
ncbi:MAG TPA: DUF2169 domain-containing protein, partial [Isosphaeraceae bacterium]|nr:DUF2169 domain-containing protein [Isosphaeraceae bacterium]